MHRVLPSGPTRQISSQSIGKTDMITGILLREYILPGKQHLTEASHTTSIYSLQLKDKSEEVPIEKQERLEIMKVKEINIKLFL